MAIHETVKSGNIWSCRLTFQEFRAESQGSYSSLKELSADVLYARIASRLIGQEWFTVGDLAKKNIFPQKILYIFHPCAAPREDGAPKVCKSLNLNAGIPEIPVTTQSDRHWILMSPWPGASI